MVFTYLFQQVKKLSEALTNQLRITADAHKIGIAVPSRNNVDMQMSRQAGTGASAKIHSDIKAVRLDGLGQGLLRFSDELCHLEHLHIRGCFKIGYMTRRSYQKMPVVIWKPV